MHRFTIRLRTAGLVALIVGSLLLSGYQVGLDSDFSNPDQIRHAAIHRRPG